MTLYMNQGRENFLICKKEYSSSGSDSATSLFRLYYFNHKDFKRTEKTALNNILSAKHDKRSNIISNITVLQALTGRAHS